MQSPPSFSEVTTDFDDESEKHDKFESHDESRTGIEA